MFCPYCGAKCQPDAIACHACGSILPGLTEQQAVGATMPAIPASSLVPPGRVDVPAPPAAPPVTPATGQSPAAAWRPGSEMGGQPQPQAQPGESFYQPARRAPSPDRMLGVVKLVVEQGKILGEQFLLTEADVIVGRYDAGSGTCPDIDLTAQDPAYVHRQHVRLVFNSAGTELFAHDLGGRNGSYVNNQKIDGNGSARVRLGDKLRIGRVVMRLQSASEAEVKGLRR